MLFGHNRGSHSLCELSVALRFHVLHSFLRDAEDERVIASDIGVNVLDDYEDETVCDVRLRIFPLGSPVRQIGVELNLSSTWTHEMRSILVNGEMSAHHVGERSWECTI